MLRLKSEHWRHLERNSHEEEEALIDIGRKERKAPICVCHVLMPYL